MYSTKTQQKTKYPDQKGYWSGSILKNKPVLKCLYIESTEQTYALHEFYLIRQVRKNDLSS